MSEAGESDDKQYEPTQKKLEDARRKGDLARSADLNAAAAYAGFYVVAFTVGASILAQMGSDLTRVFSDITQLSEEMFSGGAQRVFGDLMTSVVWAVSPWFILPLITTVLSVLVQQSFVVAPDKLTPKLSRISLLANAKNKYGRQGLFEFAKAFAKLLLLCLVLGIFLVQTFPDTVVSVEMKPVQIVAFMAELVVQFVGIVLLISVVIGAIDFLWQKSEHIRKNRMSRKELTDEAKQSEGDPHVKQQRRRRAQEIALNKMLADVPTADVVIVNPTHFAVALKWTRAPGEAPVCVAKGVDEIAARIREISHESGIPIHHDPPTARALFGTVDIGEQILPEHYRAVAAAIRFADSMAAKMAKTTGGRK
ncbi:MAG: EscU/YscU/HrcU family type III secretion system export apparatus switch protein [Marinosulfonomonas sp.]